MVKLIETVYNFLWGDLLTVPLPGGGTLPLSLLVILLIPTGVYFTIRTKFLPIRLFKDMVGALFEKKGEEQSALSVIQTLIVSTATRVGMGNLVVAAISAGGAGAVFWMWITALIGSSTAFIEATLSQIYKEKDPLYGGYRGGPAYYIHRYFEEKSGKKKRYVLLSVLFAISGLICWCGISQVVSNSVASAFKNAFHIPPIYTTVILVILAAIIVVAGILYIVLSPKPDSEELPTVEVIPAAKDNVEIYGEYVGRIKAQQFVEVRARVEGYLEKMLFEEGSFVKKDQVLFIINQEL